MDLKPNQQRAKNAKLLIWIVLFFEVLSLISSVLQYNLLKSVEAGHFITEEQANANDLRESIIGGLYFIAFVTSGVFFIRWFRRAYHNLGLLSSQLKHTEDSTVWAWFVPIISLYKPFQIMKELFQESGALILRNKLANHIPNSTIYLRIWWTLFIISSIMGNILFRWSLKNDDSFENFIFLNELYISNHVLGIPLALITIKVIKDYNKLENILPNIRIDK